MRYKSNSIIRKKHYRIAIIVPCHRVIGEDGKLVGYGGGLWRKQYLLNLEMGNLGL
ncbi:hypothetical protein B6I21_07765 [candidate division KSB1 bacterium 4572_119]|nr:MAG: hypothetical protein B6I21_07765 [candidate division KSB1 bacterium 4572_119]